MRRIITLFMVGLFVTANLFSQENPKINKDVLIEKAYDQELAKKEFKKAEKYYFKGPGTYDEALKYYLKLYNYYGYLPELNYKIGICCLFTSNKKTALKYLQNSKPEVATDYYLALGRALQYNLQFEEAKLSFDRYLKTLSKNDTKKQLPYVQQLIKECDNAAQLVKDSLPVFVINLGPVINSYYDEYGAQLSKNDTAIFFTSKRPYEEPSKVVSRFKFNERIMIANNCINAKCEYATDFADFPKWHNISLAGISPEKDKLYYYRGRRQNGNIWYTLHKEDDWKRFKQLKGRINHIAAKETSIAMADNSTTYFVSDKRGGQGGKDIYRTFQIKPNKFSKPENLGSVINTPFDEEGLYVTPDGNTLYFSSKGHSGLGGFDVYKSTKQADNSWSEPINMGYPINSPADELFYRPTPDSMIALYATVRENGYGGLDLYKIKKDPRIPFTLQGKVVDKKTGKVLPATVSVYNQITSELITSVQQDTIQQQYQIKFEDRGRYKLQIDAPDYVAVVDTIACPKKRHAVVEQNYQLDRMKHPFTISGVVRDAKTGYPLQADLLLRKEGPDSTVYARQASNAETGKYSFSFDDKYNVNITASTRDYFSVREVVMAKQSNEKLITKDFALTRSKVSYTLTGRITEEGTDKGIKAQIAFFRPNEATSFMVVNSNDSLQGKYNAVFEEKGPFLIEVRSEGYFFINDSHQFNDNLTLVVKNMSLKKIEVGLKFVMEHILFNSGLATLKTSSYPELNKLVTLMLENPKIRIEVSGHTDNVGSAASNKKLSKARALSVKNYLVSKGVESDRVEYEGYGFDQPIADNATKEGKAKNRRVEVKILQ